MHNKYRKRIGLISLLLFLFLRVGNVHAFSHWSDDQNSPHCELCDMLSFAEELTPALGSEETTISDQPALLTVDKDPITGYTEPLFCFVSPKYILNKPPPAL
ncbi:hypothetical protein BST85_07005 [Aureitalea marina]|uniref:DUF2946 domain-containing protein n=1 Tax=Aureitalea marina TaxID=930804 RepID=A0A2S7KPY2_9FLAO|nr:hypothetical protein BST85_07005 [Aureitalea marina]